MFRLLLLVIVIYNSDKIIIWRYEGKELYHLFPRVKFNAQSVTKGSNHWREEMRLHLFFTTPFLLKKLKFTLNFAVLRIVFYKQFMLS